MIEHHRLSSVGPKPYDLLRKRRPRVAFVSQPEYFRFMYENDLGGFAEVREFRLNFSAQTKDYLDLISFDADYVFCFRGEFLPDSVLEQLRGVRVALSSEPFPRLVDGRREYTRDSIERYLVFRAIRGKPFDYVFHYDAASLPLLGWDGLHVSGEFAFPVATSTYRPRERPAQWDIFFIGRSTAHRERHFGPLKHHYNFLHICHGIWGEPLVDYLCSAKICLNVHAEHEISWEPRMQMMLACGAFVISEKITPNEYLRPGIDYIEVSGPNELYEAVEHYLGDDDARAQIARSGCERVKLLLDSRSRFEELIDGIEAGRFQRFDARQGSRLLDIFAVGRAALNRFGRIGR